MCVVEGGGEGRSCGAGGGGGRKDDLISRTHCEQPSGTTSCSPLLTASTPSWIMTRGWVVLRGGGWGGGRGEGEGGRG